MGQKVNPVGFRLGRTKEHSTVWFPGAEPSALGPATRYNLHRWLKEDYFIRKYFEEKFLALSEETKEDVQISEFKIKRKSDQTNLEIHTLQAERLAYVLSREGVMKLVRSALEEIMLDVGSLCITVHKIRKPFYESRLAARALARQLEKRVAFRRALRFSMEELVKQGVRGVKIQISGRLNGVEIARSEWVHQGRVPLQTLRARISFSKENAYTKYGVIGIKFWIFEL